MKKGDVVLINFPFSDLTGSKLRPALILIAAKLDVTVCFLSTQLVQQSEFDIYINPSPKNGLKKTSLVKIGKFATLDKNLVLGRIGHLEKDDLQRLNKKLIAILQLK